MPKETRCLICTAASSRVAVAELVAQGVPLRQVALRLKLSKSCVQRHAKHAKLSAAVQARSSSGQSAQPNRATGGRCVACGIDVSGTDPKSLLCRAERAVHRAELASERAANDDDFRLELAALDRVKTTLELVMKAVNMIGGDGATVNVTIDNRRTLEAWFSGLTESQIRRLTDMLSSGVDVPAMLANQVIECNGDATSADGPGTQDAEILA